MLPIEASWILTRVLTSAKEESKAKAAEENALDPNSLYPTEPSVAITRAVASDAKLGIFWRVKRLAVTLLSTSNPVAAANVRPALVSNLFAVEFQKGTAVHIGESSLVATA